MELFLPGIALQKDERAWLLAEINLVSQKPGGGLRRIQQIIVNRDDRLVEFRRDLGPASAFQASQFRIPSLWEHTVEELMALAEHERLGNERAVKQLEEQAAESTLIPDFLRQYERAYRHLKGISTFGPGITIQNNP